MAAPKAIYFAEPVQLAGSFFRLARVCVTHDLLPLWRYACLLAVARLALQGREPRP